MVNVADTDGDGHSDGREILDSNDPLVPDFFLNLNEDWTLTVAGQTVQPMPNGSFRIDNVSAADQSPVDFRSDDCYRLTGTRVAQSGTTWFLWSEPFRFFNGTFRVTSLSISNAPGYFLTESIDLGIEPGTITAGAAPGMAVVT